MLTGDARRLYNMVRQKFPHDPCRFQLPENFEGCVWEDEVSREGETIWSRTNSEGVKLQIVEHRQIDPQSDKEALTVFGDYSFRLIYP